MEIKSGYAGKILKVDLSSRTTTNLSTENYAHRFIGGRGIAARIYWDEIPPEINAFDPDNLLIFMTGPLAGLPGLAGSRLQVCGKSPATNPETFGYSNIGGSWGAYLKFAGWDGVAIKGRSDRPVFLFIRDDRLEIRDAIHIWGKDSVETRKILKRELGDSAKIVSGFASPSTLPCCYVS